MVTPPLSAPYCAVGDGSAEDLCLAPQQPHLLGRVPSHVHLRHFCHGWYVSGYQCPSPVPPTPNTVCMLSAPPLPHPQQTLCMLSAPPLPHPHQTLCACSVPLPCPTHTKHCVHAQCPSPAPPTPNTVHAQCPSPAPPTPNTVCMLSAPPLPHPHQILCACSVPLPCPAHTKYCVHAQWPSPNSNRLITPDCYICSLAYVPAPPPAPTPFHPHTAFVALLSLNKEPLLTLHLVGLFSLVQWVSILAFPLVQAARLNASCNSLRSLGHSVTSRPLSYTRMSYLHLDSFLSYTATQAPCEYTLVIHECRLGI